MGQIPVGLPCSTSQLMDVHLQLQVIRHAVPVRLLRRAGMVVAQISHPQDPPLVECPLGDLITEQSVA